MSLTFVCFCGKRYMYKYETHLHTFPVSRCAKSSVRDSLEFYKSLGYAGVFITNHFLDGNLNADRALPYSERLDFYFSDYEDAKEIGKQIGIDVFLGIESSYRGTDFLIYGLDKAWFEANPDILNLEKNKQLKLMRSSGALIVQAHPFCEARYLDHIRLFPRDVDAIEVINAGRADAENTFAAAYADHYGITHIAGSDCHNVKTINRLAGIETDVKIENVQHFIKIVKDGNFDIFTNIL